MTLADVVPVAIPYTPADGEPTTVIIPEDTHLLHWCVLRPAVADRESTVLDGKVEKRRSRDIAALVRGVEPTLTVGGDAVGAVTDVVGSDERPGLGVWNITEPLPCGTHMATLTLRFDSRAEREDEAKAGTQSRPVFDRPPATHIVPAETDLEWTGKSASLRMRITVVPAQSDAFEAGSDPLWGHRDVCYPRTPGEFVSIE